MFIDQEDFDMAEEEPCRMIEVSVVSKRDGVDTEHFKLRADTTLEQALTILNRLSENVAYFAFK